VITVPDASSVVDRLPAGSVTFLFTDIEGSTRLVRQLGDAYVDVLETHDDLVTHAVGDEAGVVFGSQGDALFASFVDPVAAVAAALAAQRALRAHPWDGHEVRVRMGIHTGTAALRGGTYVGLDVHRVARICSAARGGQVLVSAVTAAAVAGHLPGGARLVDLGLHRLKGMPDADRLYDVTHPELS
jgi:class 3 adenylate cyclase